METNLQTLMYYLYEYEQNEDNLEAKEYLDDLMVGMIGYCNEILGHQLGISGGYKLLKLRCLMSYGKRDEYKRIFEAIDRELKDLFKYLKIVRSNTKKLQELNTYEALDLNYVLLIFCNRILSILNEYTDTIVKLNNKNSGMGERVFLGTEFDREAKENKECIEEVVKSLGK